MRIEPDGVDNIVVLVCHDKHFQYYISDKELWILNEKMLQDAFRAKGYNMPLFKNDPRYEYQILSEKNVGDFLPKIKEYAVGLRELKEYYELYSNLYNDAEYVAKPIFCIDFDARIFYSFYSEPGSYEVYMPDGWQGICCPEKREELVPEGMKYWM